MATTPEGKVVKAITRWLDSLPQCWYFKVHGGLFQKVGIPDLVGCLQGRFFAIEVKAPGKEPTQIQLFTLRKIKEAGGLCGWVDSLDEAKQILGQILSKNSR